MTITTVAINCDIGLANGTEFTAAQIEFTLSEADYDTVSNDSIPAATTVVDLDASGVGTANLWPVTRGTRNTQYSVVLIGSRTINGRVPMMVGRQATTNDTFYVDQTSNITFTNTRFDYNPAVRSHLNLVRGGGSGPWGRATLVGCVITCTQAQLVTATVPTQSIVCIGCVDGNGAPFNIV